MHSKKLTDRSCCLRSTYCTRIPERCTKNKYKHLGRPSSARSPFISLEIVLFFFVNSCCANKTTNPHKSHHMPAISTKCLTLYTYWVKRFMNISYRKIKIKNPFRLPHAIPTQHKSRALALNATINYDAAFDANKIENALRSHITRRWIATGLWTLRVHLFVYFFIIMTNYYDFIFE